MSYPSTFWLGGIGLIVYHRGLEYEHFNYTLLWIDSRNTDKSWKSYLWTLLVFCATDITCKPVIFQISMFWYVQIPKFCYEALMIKLKKNHSKTSYRIYLDDFTFCTIICEYKMSSPDQLSGLVQILFFQLDFFNLDQSRFIFVNWIFFNLDQSRFEIFNWNLFNLDWSRFKILKCNFSNLDQSRFGIFSCTLFNLD